MSAVRRSRRETICSDVSSPAALRDEIPLLEDVVYLNTGASGPTPRTVQAAVEDGFADHADAHHGSPYPHASEVADDVRATVAGFVGTSADEVALTSNTTEGLNAVADCYRWSSDDRVVTTELEHPAGVLPWRRLERVHGVDVEVVDGDADGLDRDGFHDAVEGATLVCFSSRSWMAVDIDVERLVDVAHDAGADVVVDAAQSIGAEDVDFTDWGAEYVAAPGHKWLMAPWGTGLLYVDSDVDGEAQTRAGYRSVASPHGSGELRDSARRFELSTESPALRRGLEAAVEVSASVGTDAVESHVEELTERLRDGLGDRVVSSAGGLVRFTDPALEETVERLQDEGVVLRSLPGDCLRASLHAFNTAEDVDRLLEAL